MVKSTAKERLNDEYNKRLQDSRFTI